MGFIYFSRHFSYRKIKKIHPYFDFRLGNTPIKPSNIFNYINKILIGLIVGVFASIIATNILKIFRF